MKEWKKIKKRKLWVLIVWSILTLGIYSLIWIHSFARDINQMCKGVGDKTRGIVGLIILTILTIGIYQFIWLYAVGERLRDNGGRYDVDIKDGGAVIVLFSIIPFFGAFISYYILIRSFNSIADAWNDNAPRDCA